ncbi:Cytidyltransferase-like domain-containing protein [Entamoeba marina]
MQTIHTSIYLDKNVSIPHISSILPSRIIPVEICTLSTIQDPLIEASKALSSVLSFQSNMTYCGICITPSQIIIRDPIRLIKCITSITKKHIEDLLFAFERLPNNSHGSITSNSLRIEYINYIESYWEQHHIFCIQKNGLLSTLPPSSPVIYSGTFNPFHIAHKKILEYVTMRYPTRPIVVELSQRSEDKTPTSLTNTLIRASQVAGLYNVIISNTSLYVDKAKYYENGIFVVGYDTAVRIFDKKYYKNSVVNMRNAFETIRKCNCKFIVVGRFDEKSQQFCDFKSIKNTLPCQEYHHLFISLSQTHFRYDFSSTQLRNNGKNLNHNILPKL